MTEIDLGITADMHVHLRDGKMMELVTPTVRQGGVSVAYVMPNLAPPVTTLERVQRYRKDLQALAPKTTFLMSLYLCKDLTPELIHAAAKAGAIHGVKCYPAGVTTNSSAGVDPNDFTPFYPVFEALQAEDLVLNLHGEKPPVKDGDIHVLNAEPEFLPALVKLARDFPKLKIILEHCTTKAAVDTVRKLHQENPACRVAATITAHHLSLTIDSWAGNPINFCKPVAKLPADMRALVDAATSGELYFFFGSDLAPHPIESKAKHVGVCAGVYTQLHAIAYLAEVFESAGKLEHLVKFVSENGKAFYGIKDADLVSKDRAVLVARENQVPEEIGNSSLTVVPFKAGDNLKYAVEWRECGEQ
ncbi:Dihydroorotase homodimeric type [Metschnikowia bicuspidata var. bicuspidata NRRL YB-4993]|uniref:dihydroorotase n=1 Tax=Metschnikowia bicuspidata var. bicuspidata NRRL YB-4993 TaxID=869754 RepID=A0A1A0HFJ2_9ASCO|nr:Dihydroorotase homodimeric type [Metschnikowia bicuspidata var. bicuspidata NRRL YB-4993]OBA22755.1 Dihydroorotase homodimeric type [Metschnikowia bicuspidata var. bicuspidata NRRL YB-4993]